MKTFFKYVGIIIKAIAQFLHFPYASEFHDGGKYKLEGRELTKAELLEFYEGLANSFPIISIEDPFAEDDFEGRKLKILPD